jgi:cytochrome c oxidase cbb3-type subunit 3
MKTIRQTFIMILCLLAANQTFAQSKYFWGNGTTEDLLGVFVLIALISVIVLLGLLLIGMFTLYQVITGNTTKPILETASFWEKLGNLRPMAQEKELLLQDSYDGIQELDNPVPAWFNALFYGTVAIGIVYLLVYHSWNSAPLQTQEYENEVFVAETLKRQRLANAPADNIDENNVKLLTDNAVVSAGKGTYMQYCAACHGKLGEGLVGPNLTDEFWIHGGTINNIFKTIKYGVTEKGMVAWGTQLTPTQMSNVANFILSLKGTNPPNAKEAQGVK